MKKIKIFGNLLSMGLALFFLVLLYMWIYQKETVIAGGKRFIINYKYLYQLERDEALAEFKKGNINALTELLEDWKDFRKGDRIYSMKRNLLLTLVKELHVQNRFNELLHWSKIWYDLDERDVTARAYWYEALRHSPNRQEDGLEGLKKEWHNFPKNTALTQFYSNVAKENGDLETYKRVLITNFRQGWKAYFSAGKGFKTLKTLDLSFDKNDWWQISLEVPSNSIDLRVDPPFTYSKISISKIQLVVNEATHMIQTDRIKMNDMKYNGDLIETMEKKDPYFYFKAQEFLNNSKGKKIKVLIRLKIVMPKIT